MSRSDAPRTTDMSRQLQRELRYRLAGRWALVRHGARRGAYRLLISMGQLYGHPYLEVGADAAPGDRTPA